MAGTQTPNRQPATLQMEGKVVTGGELSRRMIKGLLGFEATGSQVKVKAVAWVNQAVQATLSLGNEKDLIFTIARRTEQGDGIVVTPTLVVSYSGGDLPRPMARQLESVGAQRLASWDIHRVAELIAGDPEAGEPGQPAPSTDSNPNRPRSLLDTWGPSDAYADFFAGGELARGQLDSLDPSSLFVFVQHSDAECNHVNPHGIAPIVWLVNYPWDDRVRHDKRPWNLKPKDPEKCGQMLTTDLTETDVIMGNPDKVRRALELGAKEAKRVGRTLFFSNTCVPVVTGEDVESEVRRCGETCECPMLFLTTTPRSMVNVFHDVLVTQRLAAEASAAPPNPDLINLVGFPDNRGTGELAQLLGQSAITVNARILPQLEVDIVTRLPRGAVNVMWPNAGWQHMYDQLTFESRTPFVMPAAPYGIQGTRDWLMAVADTVSRRERAEEAWAHELSRWQDLWDALSVRAKGYRLALVVRGNEMHYLAKPAETWGVPMVSMLEEMGFGLDLLVKLDGIEQAAKAAKVVQELFKDPARHSFKGFNSPEMLTSRLAACPAKAVLTYHFYDWRVTQAGKNLFSLQHFECGLPGAVRTLERLVGICSNPFYQRYRRYLKRTPEGLRAPPVVEED